MIVGLFRRLRTATRPYAALNPGGQRRQISCAPETSVSHVPGLTCYLCTRPFTLRCGATYVILDISRWLDVAGDAVVILDVFAKKTEATPQGVLATCRRRLTQYRAATKTRTRR